MGQVICQRIQADESLHMDAHLDIQVPLFGIQEMSTLKY
jgi:hypothetical protein